MFFITVRASTLKFCGTLLLGVLLVTGLVFLLPTDESIPAGASDGRVVYDGITDTQTMADFLLQFGWQIAKEPVSDETVVLPEKVEGVYAAYNQLQKEQGLDLAPFGGKSVRRVVFTVTNYPNATGAVQATLFVYRNSVVAGDLSSGEPDGFVCGFAGKSG